MIGAFNLDFRKNFKNNEKMPRCISRLVDLALFTPNDN